MNTSIKSAILFVLILLCGSVYCSAKPSKETAVMVVVDGITIEQFVKSDSAEYQKLFSIGALGLMNNKAAGFVSYESNCATIGAGSRVNAANTSWLSCNSNSKAFGGTAWKTFEKKTGANADSAEILYFGIDELINKNIGRRYTIIPGLLGSQLKKSNIDTAVYGNSDLGKFKRRAAVAIAMDTHGRITYGDLMDGKLIEAPDMPYGVKMDYEYIFQSIKNLKGKRNFIVVESGDTGRIDNSNLNDEQKEALKLNAMNECGQFLLHMQKYLEGTTDRYMLLLISVNAGIEPNKIGNRLTPVIIIGSDIQQGILYSNTTRRNGLIANLDIAPTILKFFEVNIPDAMIGHTVKSVSSNMPSNQLISMNNQMTATFDARIPTLILYAVLICLSLIISILSLTICSNSNFFIFSISNIRLILTAVILAPLVILIAPGFGIYNKFGTIFFLIVVSGALSCLLNYKFEDLRYVFICVSIAAVSVILIDILFGARLLMRSVIGHDSISGIRFYGIGNEYTGVLIGSLLLGVYSFYDLLASVKKPHVAITAIICLLAIFLIGSPMYGTNFGGMLTALVAFGLPLTKLYEGQAKRKVIIFTAIVGILFMSIILALNIFTKDQSHIGSAISSGLNNGISVYLDIAIRKWSMNLRLLSSSIWSISLVGLMLALTVIFFKPAGILNVFLTKHNKLNAGFIGMVVGAIVAMFTNDSGVSMAATILLYLALPLIMMVKSEIIDLQKDLRALNAASEQAQE